MSNVVAGYFGGGAGYKDGTWTAPTFTVKVFDQDGNGAEKNYANVADALSGVSSSFTNLDKKIENIVINAAGDGLVKQDTSGLITIGGKVSGTKVSIANVNNEARILSGINAGSITATSTDAINGSQLYSMSNVVAGYLSSNAGYDEDGNWNAPTFTVKVFDQVGSGTEKEYTNVADALSGVSSSFTNLNNKIESVTGDSLVKQNSAGLITIGGSKGGRRIDIADSVNLPRTLSGVKGGAFTKTSTEAINGSQLYAMSQEFANYFGGGAGFNKGGKWSGPTFTVKTFDKDGNETEVKYTNVADAFAGVNSSLAGLNSAIAEVKDATGVGEKFHVSANGDLYRITDDSFPFMGVSLVKRSLPATEEGNGETTNNIPFPSDTPEVSSKPNLKVLRELADGDVFNGSDNAITGNQLFDTNKKLVAYMGGGADYNNTVWTAPKFIIKSFSNDGTVGQDEKSDVFSAFNAMNDAMININTRLVNVEKKEKATSNDVTSNALQWNEDKKAYDLSHEGEASKLANVEDGSVVENSKEAVNGGQLWTTQQKVAEVEKKANAAVSYDIDKDSGKKTNTISLAGGDDSQPVLIENVQDGEIAEHSKQAVNGGQLHEKMKTVLDEARKYTDERFNETIRTSLNEAKSYTDTKFEALSYDIKNVRDEARQAAAIGLAVSNLRYFDEPGSLSLSVGGGLWRGQSAFAIGAGYTSEDGKIRSNLSATSAGGHFGVGGGITLRLK